MDFSRRPTTADAKRLPPGTSLEHARFVLLVSLIVLSAAAWIVTLRQTGEMAMPMGIVVRDPAGAATAMDGMAMGEMSGDDRPVTAALTFVAVWAVMMAAMMLPATAPMLLILAAAQGRWAVRSPVAPTWVFTMGYLAVWTVVGLAVYVLIQLGSAFASGLPPVSGRGGRRSRWGPRWSWLVRTSSRR